MIQSLLDTTVVGAGQWFDMTDLRPNDLEGRPPTFQATVHGTGSVSATVVFEATNDRLGAVLLETITLSGSGLASDGFALDAAWGSVRARVSAISGTGARVVATAGV